MLDTTRDTDTGTTAFNTSIKSHHKNELLQMQTLKPVDVTGV